MANPPPITPENVLEELHESIYVTEMRLAPTSPKFTLFLENPVFAAQVHAAVGDKIAYLRMDKKLFPDASAQRKATKGWERLLAKIEESLYPDAMKR